MSMDLEEQYDKIYRYCYYKLKDQETAEDITQETFLRFLEKGRYQEKGQRLNYLYTIARNLCIDEYRKNWEEPLEKEKIEAAQTEKSKTETGLEEGLVQSLWIKEALEELTEEDREILLLRYVNQMPVSAICKLFGVSRFVLYRRLQKSAKVLQKYLKKEDL